MTKNKAKRLNSRRRKLQKLNHKNRSEFRIKWGFKILAPKYIEVEVK